MPNISDVTALAAHRRGLVWNVTRPLITLTLCLSALYLLAVGPTHAQYAPTAASGPYSGGTASGSHSQTTPYSAPYGPVSGGYGATAAANVMNVAQCSGTISTSFTWKGAAPAPQSAVIVENSAEVCSAKSYGYPTAGDPSAACADGMGDMGIVTTSYGVVERNVPAEAKSTSLSHTRYSVQGGQTISLTCSPSASAMSPAGPFCSAAVTYSAAAYPVTINIGVGGATPTNTAQQALTGQEIKASLSLNGAPTTIQSYSFTVSGQVFATWDYDAPGDGLYPTQYVPLSSTYLNGTSSPANAYFYDEHNNDTATVTCTATVEFPDNTTQTVTAVSQPVTSVKPTVEEWGVNQTPGQNGEPQTFVFGTEQNGTLVMQANEIWNPIVISVPSPFNLGSGKEGTGALCQLIESLSYSDFRHPMGSAPSEYTEQFQNPQGQDVPIGVGLDGGFPFSSGYPVTGGVIQTNSPIADYTWDVSGNGTAGDGPLLAVAPSITERVGRVVNPIYSSGTVGGMAVDFQGSEQMTDQGDALAKQGDGSGAAAAYRKALDLWAGNKVAHYGLARTAAASGDLATAIQNYRAAIYTNDPKRFGTVPGDGYQENDPSRLMAYVLVLDKAGQDQEAVSVYNRAVVLLDYDPSDGRPDQDVLLPQFGDGLGQKPYSPQEFEAMTHLTIGVDTNEDAQRRDETLQAITLAPDSAAANYYWGKYLYAHSQVGAKEYLQKAVELGDDQTVAAAKKILQFLH